MTIPHLDAEEVHRRLPISAAVEALEEALRAGLDPEAELPRAVVEVKGGALLVLPSAAAAHPVVKLVAIGVVRAGRLRRLPPYAAMVEATT